VHGVHAAHHPRSPSFAGEVAVLISSSDPEVQMAP
jgi:hypothetical protein